MKMAIVVVVVAAPLFEQFERVVVSSYNFFFVVATHSRLLRPPRARTVLRLHPAGPRPHNQGLLQQCLQTCLLQQCLVLLRVRHLLRALPLEVSHCVSLVKV